MADAQHTEKPTPRRLEKARGEGRFPASRELCGAAQFLAFTSLAAWCGAEWCAGLFTTTRRLLERAVSPALLGPVELAQLARSVAWNNLAPLAAGGGLVALAALAAQMGTTRLGFAPGNLAPKFSRLNFATRLRELPRQNIPQAIQGMVLLPLVGFAVWALVRDNFDALVAMPLASAVAGTRQMTDMILALLWKAAALFVVMGVIDYWRQHRRYMADLRMSKQEIREESKEQEGNPQIRGRLRQLRREWLRRRMMSQVPQATAVVVNPTHYAVAIRYAIDSATAPTVVAKGKNYLALRIRRKAVEHQVPIIENPPLAQALYKSCEVGQEIPEHLYRAVAEVLAYIFRLMGGRLPA
jgi:flagellar biosynthesis protein FlhB